MDLDLTIRYLDDLTALNVTVPAKSIAAADVYREALRTAAATPASDLNAALLDGTLTVDNVAEQVRGAALELAAQQNAHQIVRNLGTTINRAIRDAIREDVDRIIGELQATFDPAAAQVTAAAQHFGPDTTAEEIVTAKPDVVKRWNAVAAHSRTLDEVSRVYRSLLSDITRQLPDEIVTLFVAGTVDLHQASELYRERSRWLALAHNGFTLHLNTPAEAARVAEASAQVLADQAAAERNAGLAAHRFRHRLELAAADRASR